MVKPNQSVISKKAVASSTGINRLFRIRQILRRLVPWLSGLAALMSLILVLLYANVATLSFGIVLGFGLVLFICSILSWLMLREVGSPPIEPIAIVDSDIVLEIADRSGKYADYSKQQTVIANIDNVTSYVEQGLKPDPHGSLADFKAFSTAGEEGYRKNNYEVTDDGKYNIFFDPVPKKGEIFQRKIQCGFIDSFTQDREWFTCLCSRTIRIVKITIVFPNDRAPKSTSLSIIDQYSNIRVEDPGFIQEKMLDGGIKIIWLKKYPIRGASYKIMWEW